MNTSTIIYRGGRKRESEKKREKERYFHLMYKHYGNRNLWTIADKTSWIWCIFYSIYTASENISILTIEKKRRKRYDFLEKRKRGKKNTMRTSADVSSDADVAITTNLRE